MSRSTHQPSVADRLPQRRPLDRQPPSRQPDDDQVARAAARAVPHEQPVAVAQGRLHRAAADHHDAPGAQPARRATHAARHGVPTTPGSTARTGLAPRARSSVAGDDFTDPTTKGPACSRDCSHRPSKSRPTATCPAASTTRPRPASRPSRSRRIIAKVADNDDPDFRTRAILIKEQRAELVKHHLWVLWTDYFKPPHFEKYPQLHQLVNEATKLAGATGAKGSLDAEVADDLLAKIDEIAEIFWETKKCLSRHLSDWSPGLSDQPTRRGRHRALGSGAERPAPSVAATTG